ncbi:MAG: nitrogen fixation protein NifX [Polyangiaceae bacterium]
MRVAFASTDGKTVNAHFGHAECFYLWDIGPNTAAAVGRVKLTSDAEDGEDRIVAKARALDGCTLVYITQIGGPAAAKLVGHHIQPVKALSDTPIDEAILKLQTVLQNRPPPWLRKALGAKGEAETADEESSSLIT